MTKKRRRGKRKHASTDAPHWRDEPGEHAHPANRRFTPDFDMIFAALLLLGTLAWFIRTYHPNL